MNYGTQVILFETPDMLNVCVYCLVIQPSSRDLDYPLWPVHVPWQNAQRRKLMSHVINNMTSIYSPNFMKDIFDCFPLPLTSKSWFHTENMFNNSEIHRRKWKRRKLPFLEVSWIFKNVPVNIPTIYVPLCCAIC